MFKNDGMNIWKFNDVRRAVVPKEEDRESLIMDTHIELEHRMLGPVHYQLKKNYYRPGMKDKIKEVLRKCERCSVMNRKKKGGCDFVSVSRPLRR